MEVDSMKNGLRPKNLNITKVFSKEFVII